MRRMLTEADREEISPRGIAEHAGGRVIAERMGRDPSVISRDVARHGGRARYRATVAGRAAGGDDEAGEVARLIPDFPEDEQQTSSSAE